MTADVASLLAQIDSRNASVMGIIADWYEDRGDRLASAWRWLAAERKWPMGSVDFPGEVFLHNGIEPLSNAVKDAAVYDRLRPLHKNNAELLAYYRLRSEALADWARAIAEGQP